ncbi:unnamed protein product [Rhizoctonia solani]|uniref:F-box domain-containing protein n=1 Tax=Rhizoctonia solani TaxID=456999 RepID=A0A8H3BJT5_9AGAM|nr:unnamed protein product [Rhizoctonia solani]
MGTCTNLRSSSLKGLAIKAEDLVPRIDRHIASLSSVVLSQTTQTQSVLSTTRNRMASRIDALPEEVLVEIFTQVIYNLADKKYHLQNWSMEQEVRSIYQRLYSLISVCSSWRDIVLRNKGFWSLVPMLDPQVEKATDWLQYSGQLPDDAIERSICRSSGTGLYVAINASARAPTLLPSLTNLGSRIRALDIRIHGSHNIQGVMSNLATILVPGIISKLSIAIGSRNDPDYRFFDHRPERRELYKQILGSLHSLRIRNMKINLYETSFTKLVELRLENIQIGDRSIKRLLGTISTASNLQYLHLASLRTVDPHDPIIQPQDTINDDELSISLPNLKLVYLDGMSFHDLELIFGSIVPGNEEWVVSLASYCMNRVVLGMSSKVSVGQLALLLGGFNVNTLILYNYPHMGNWLDGPQLCQLLKAVPIIKTLKMDGWDFYQEQWEALARPQGLTAGSNEFPCIHNLHIYGARIFHEHGIQAVVTSHNIQQLRLGGRLAERSSLQDREIVNDDDIVTWLRSNVADFQLMSLNEHRPEDGNKRRLW